MNKKNLIAFLLAIFALLVIIFVLYKANSTGNVSYFGLGESDISNIGPQIEIKKDILVSDEKLNSDKIEFVQRKITGGGTNPGWVISLVETQPNIFTGRVIVDDGVYQHPVTLREEVSNIFVGEMKSIIKKSEVFSMKKIDENCTDEEGNIFRYSLSGTYGATKFSGCGGEVVKAKN